MTDGSCTDGKSVAERVQGTHTELEYKVMALTQENERINRRLAEEAARCKTLEGDLMKKDQLLKDAQSHLMQSEKMASVGQLAAGVAHEINNPVAYVKSNMSALRQHVNDMITLIDAYESMEHRLEACDVDIQHIKTLKEKLDVEYLKRDLKELISESDEGLDRVKKIVTDLKDFSHVSEAEWKLDNIHKGLESTLNMLHNEIKYKAEIMKEFGDIPLIECIPSQLNQVFTNLLINACQAIEHQGVITVRTGAEQDRVWVEISDTGSGIAPEHLPRIFDPFFTTKPVGQGTGFGLSISYKIVRGHGGRIEVQSQAGHGTTFRIWLPVSRQEAGQAAGGVQAGDPAMAATWG